MNWDSIEYADGSKYEGEVQNGERQGRGTWTRPDGIQYIGQWKNDRPDGQGTITFPDGKKFEGQWKNGKRHGEGVEFRADGTSLEGVWEEGEFIREKKIAPIKDKGEDLEGFDELDLGARPEQEPGQPFKTNEDRLPGQESEAETGREPFYGQKYKEDLEDLQHQSKGFLTSLFDVSMKEMVTPKIIRIFYIIGLIGIALGALGTIVGALFTAFDNGFGTFLLAVIGAPIGAFLAVIMLRVYLELIILLFNIYDQLKEIKLGLKR